MDREPLNPSEAHRDPEVRYLLLLPTEPGEGVRVVMLEEEGEAEDGDSGA